MPLRVGQRCRLRDDRGVNAEVRGAVLEVRKAQGNAVHGYIRTGPARGASYTVHVDEIASCGASLGPLAGTRRRRKRRR